MAQRVELTGGGRWLWWMARRRATDVGYCVASRLFGVPVKWNLIEIVAGILSSLLYYSPVTYTFRVVL